MLLRLSHLSASLNKEAGLLTKGLDVIGGLGVRGVKAALRSGAKAGGGRAKALGATLAVGGMGAYAALPGMNAQYPNAPNPLHPPVAQPNQYESI